MIVGSGWFYLLYDKNHVSDSPKVRPKTAKKEAGRGMCVVYNTQYTDMYDIMIL